MEPGGKAVLAIVRSAVSGEGEKSLVVGAYVKGMRRMRYTWLMEIFITYL